MVLFEKENEMDFSNFDFRRFDFQTILDQLRTTQLETFEDHYLKELRNKTPSDRLKIKIYKKF